MLRSMTGYGAATRENENVIIRVEIKSVNSKFLDLSIRMPRQFAEQETILRSTLSSRLERGKIGLNIEVEYLDPTQAKKNINKGLLLTYISELKEVCKEAGISEGNLLQSLLILPDVMQSQNLEPEVMDWSIINEALMEALDNYDGFRKTEGANLEIEIVSYFRKIDKHRLIIDTKKDERIIKVKNNIKEKLKEYLEDGTLDKNRLEQEMIFYSEKLDISEEIVRLGSHIEMFEAVLKEDYPGKKMGFILQEMGREINTIGSKANDAELLKSVVIMKDELEKIKEQSFNIL